MKSRRVINNKHHMNKGKIVQIIGPVVDVYFESGLPAIKNALTTRVDNREITLEVAQHVGLGRARAIALQDTAGLARGAEVTDTGGPGTVPGGEQVLGRLFNVVGEPIDGKGRGGGASEGGGGVAETRRGPIVRRGIKGASKSIDLIPVSNTSALVACSLNGGASRCIGER